MDSDEEKKVYGTTSGSKMAMTETALKEATQ